MTLYDSFANKDRSSIFNVAHQIAENSGWLASNINGHPAHHAINVVEQTEPECPRQSNRAVCGLYAIFSAWAHMLDIPIFSGLRRRSRMNGRIFKYGSAADFEEHGRQIVNAAVAGVLDMSLIQAFFNRYGYLTAEYAESDATVVQIRTLAEGVTRNIRQQSFIDYATN